MQYTTVITYLCGLILRFQSIIHASQYFAHTKVIIMAKPIHTMVLSAKNLSTGITGCSDCLITVASRYMLTVWGFLECVEDCMCEELWYIGMLWVHSSPVRAVYWLPQHNCSVINALFLESIHFYTSIMQSPSVHCSVIACSPSTDHRGASEQWDRDLPVPHRRWHSVWSQHKDERTGALCCGG